MGDPGLVDGVLGVPVDGSRHAPRPASESEVARYAETAFLVYAGPLHYFALSMVHDPDLADDLVQDTFVRLVREVREGRVPLHAGAWLHRVCANLAVSGVRHASSARRAMPRLIDTAVPASPEDVAERRDLDERVLAAIAVLPRDARAALLLAADGLGSREIGELIGRSPVATRALLCRARMRLHRVVEA